MEVIIDAIGVENDDPGSGWDVAGITNATANHTLVRQLSVTGGNGGDWSTSAGTMRIIQSGLFMTKTLGII